MFRAVLFALATFAVSIETSLTQLDYDEESLPRINLTVYYEGLDRICKDFFVNQLQPSYRAFSDEINVELIPFGRAQAIARAGTAGLDFKCTHGPNECSMNKMMACANSVLDKEDPAKSILFSTCVLKAGAPILQNPNECAELVGLTGEYVQKCAASPLGEYYLDKMGKVTPKNIPKLPMIYVNGRYNPDFESQILENMKLFVCGYQNNKPSACNNGTTAYE